MLCNSASITCPPNKFQGDKLNKIILENGVWELENSPARYVKELVAKVDNYLAELEDARW